MNRGRLVIGLSVAAILGIFASSIVYRAISQASARRPATALKVVVATDRLPLGTRLQAQNLRLIAWPAEQPLPGMFTRIQDCVDRALTTSVLASEPILEGKLAPKESGSGLPATIPEGMRAISVAVNDVVGVAGFVQPGTVVDVLVTGATDVHSGSSGNVTRTILENVRVLAAGQKIEQDKQGQAQTVPVITLLVSPEDANRLAMASTQGRIQLALRNTIDSKKVEPAAVFQAGLFGGTVPSQPRRTVARGPAEPPPAPSSFSVEVIRASKREITTFTNP
ncbi:MAG: Flp pilus assembly protein CpaB [Acidobacteria bacterium]|nr:Flp pilus assembly protein CpaB [Acidobacteriota bacterium]